MSLKKHKKTPAIKRTHPINIKQRRTRNTYDSTQLLNTMLGPVPVKVPTPPMLAEQHTLRHSPLTRLADTLSSPSKFRSISWSSSSSSSSLSWSCSVCLASTTFCDVAWLLGCPNFSSFSSLPRSPAVGLVVPLLSLESTRISLETKLSSLQRVDAELHV